MKKTFLIVCIALISGILTACGPQLKTIGSTKYYVEVQNEGESYTEQGHTRYEYELIGYNEDGEDKKLTFTSNHQLKSGAYLQIYDKNDEVITYEEIKHDDMPKKPQQLLEDGSNS